MCRVGGGYIKINDFLQPYMKKSQNNKSFTRVNTPNKSKRKRSL